MAQHVLHIISIWIIILPLVAGLINYQGLNEDSKWVFYLTIIAVPPQLLTYFFFTNETRWLNISYNLYTPFEFVLMFFLFKKKFENRINRKIQTGSAILYLILSLFFVVKYGFVEHFIEYWVCANNIIYILWIMIFLKEQYNSDSFIIRKSNPFAWYIMALIIYAPCTLLVFCLYYYVRDPHKTELMHLWLIQIVCNILLYIFFAIGLFISKKEKMQEIT